MFPRHEVQLVELAEPEGRFPAAAFRLRLRCGVFQRSDLQFEVLSPAGEIGLKREREHFSVTKCHPLRVGAKAFQRHEAVNRPGAFQRPRSTIQRAVAVAAVAFGHIDGEAPLRRRRVGRVEDVREGGDGVAGQVQGLGIPRRRLDIVNDLRL